MIIIMDEIIPYAHSNDIFEDAKQIIHRFSTRRVENPFTPPQSSFPHSKFADIRGFGNKGRC